jgi:hypothetical protein
LADNDINAFRGFKTLLFGFGLAGSAAVVVVVAVEAVDSGVAVVACTAGVDGLIDDVNEEDGLVALLVEGKFNVVVVNPVDCAGAVGNVLA